MIVLAYPGRIVPLEIFMARKFGMGFFGVLFEALGIFLRFDFCPCDHSCHLKFEVTPPPWISASLKKVDAARFI